MQLITQMYKGLDIRLDDIDRKFSKPGIYCWHCIDANMWYVGECERIGGVRARIMQRRHEMKGGNGQPSLMQKHWDDGYIFDVFFAEEWKKNLSDITILEQEWIRKLQDNKMELYNKNMLIKDVRISNGSTHAIERVRRISKEVDSGCWIANSPDSDGYGSIQYLGQKIGIHRLAYKAMNPTVDMTGKVVRHMCHNHACCNPKHLELGSYMDNMRDSAKKKEAFGEIKSFAEWLADERCVVKNRATLQNRIRYGWAMEKALTFPVRQRKRAKPRTKLTLELQNKIIETYKRLKSLVRTGQIHDVSTSSVKRTIKKWRIENKEGL